MGDDAVPPAEVDPSAELVATVAQTVSLFAAGGVQETLDLVVGLAVSTIEGCDYAGIFLLEGQAVHDAGVHRRGGGVDRRPPARQR